MLDQVRGFGYCNNDSKSKTLQVSDEPKVSAGPQDHPSSVPGHAFHMHIVNRDLRNVSARSSTQSSPQHLATPENVAPLGLLLMSWEGGTSQLVL